MENYREKLIKILGDADRRAAGYSLVKYIQQFENVCLYGTGKFFNDVFESHELKKILHVNYITDSNDEKVNDFIHNKKKAGKYEGISFIHADELCKISNVVIVTMFQDDWDVRRKYSNYGIPVVGGFETALEMDIDSGFDGEAESSKFLGVYDLFEDEYSKELYVEIMANRIAPWFAEKSYGDLSLNEPYYFNSKGLKLNHDEIFVDCGAYNGDTIQDFLNEVNDEFEHIYAFELARENYLALKDYTGSLPFSEKITLIEAGVGEKNYEVKFGKNSAGPDDGFSLSQPQICTQTGQIRKIDDVLSGQKVTLIKMDIEGSEMSALKGAENVIRENHPRMLICAYHRITDFYKVPEFLLSIHADYKFRLMHQSRTVYDTVLVIE